MNDPLHELKLDHVGIEVSDLEAATRTYVELFGYQPATAKVLNTRHQVEVVFLEKPGSIPIKLFRNVTAARPALTKLHHLAFRTDEIQASVDALVAHGARLLSPPQPGEAFDDEPIAFLYAGGLNVELVSTDKRRNRLTKPSDNG